MDREMIIVLDFGGQYNQLIARRVRECNVYCEVHPYNLGLDKIREMNPKGIIFTGGPDVVFEDGAPRCSKEIFELGVPVLGICYGAQLMSYLLDGVVKKAPVSEYGHTEVDVDTDSPLFDGVSPQNGLLDEPWRLYRAGAAGIQGSGPHGRLSGGGHGTAGEEFLRRAVPS